METLYKYVVSKYIQVDGNTYKIVRDYILASVRTIQNETICVDNAAETEQETRKTNVSALFPS